MTGTSLDGLDAVLTRITGERIDMRAEFVAMTSHSLGDVADMLRSMANGHAHPPIDYLRAARRLGEVHAQACAELADGAATRGGARVNFVVAHGQTIWHAPRDPVGAMSWQLFNPWPIVRRLEVPVCYDLRQADLIAGGEGAPITPMADPILYPGEGDMAVVNLGGICNVTYQMRAELSSGVSRQIEASDVCPCNLLLDGLCQRLTGQRFDRDGQLAAHAHPSPPLRDIIARHVDRARGDAGSLGREQFNAAWIDGIIAQAPDEPAQRWLASAVSWLSRTMMQEIERRLPRRIILAGGGARHGELVRAMRSMAPQGVNVLLSDEVGIPCEAREAMGFAVLGALSQDGVPITLPTVTGSDTPSRAGAWVYP